MAARNGKIAFPPKRKKRLFPFNLGVSLDSPSFNFFFSNTRHEILGKEIQYLVTVFQT